VGQKDNDLDLNPVLLDNPRAVATRPGDLRACLNAHGLYNSFQFVLRLSPVVHRQLEALPSGIVIGKIEPRRLQAFSTYLHETIHWWQHVGSSAGFMLSLSYPAQAHANYAHLKNLLTSIGPKKSMQRLIEMIDGPEGHGTTTGLANTVVNNHYDIEFFRILVTNPSLVSQVLVFEGALHDNRRNRLLAKLDKGLKSSLATDQIIGSTIGSGLSTCHSYWSLQPNGRNACNDRFESSPVAGSRIDKSNL
jgi:hypothetical protein